MGETILKTNIPRDNKYIYYCATDKATGNVTVCKALMARYKPKKEAKK